MRYGKLEADTAGYPVCLNFDDDSDNCDAVVIVKIVDANPDDADYERAAEIGEEIALRFNAHEPMREALVKARYALSAVERLTRTTDEARQVSDAMAAISAALALTEKE